MPAESSEQPDAVTAGLEQALRSLSEQLSAASGLTALIDEEPAGDEEHLRLETVRLLVPAYQANSETSRINAHVLVEAYGPDRARAADRLAAAMLKVLSGRHWDLVADEPSNEFWLSLGRPARPAFVVTVPLTLAVARERPPLVREGLDVRSGPIRQVHGRVVADDGTPLSGARVRLLPGGRPIEAAHDGTFSLSLPALDVVLEASAHGASTRHRLAAAHPSTDPVEIVLTELSAAPDAARSPSSPSTREV